MRRNPTIAAVLLVVTLIVGGVTAGRGSAATAQEATPGSAEIEATVQQFYDVFNTGDFTALDEILAADWASFAPNPGPGNQIENFQATVLLFRTAFPDLNVQTEEFVIDGDRVAVRSTVTGTHEGEFLGVPATGTEIRTQFIDIHHLEDNVIAESYHVEDLLGVFFQVGAFPPLAAPAATPAA